MTKSHMTRPGFEPGSPQWEAGDLPPEIWRGLQSNLVTSLVFEEWCPLRCDVGCSGRRFASLKLR
jgi:hypothetical protein